MAVTIGYFSARKLISCVAKLPQQLETYTRPLLSNKRDVFVLGCVQMVLSEVHGSCLSSRNSRDVWKIMARKEKQSLSFIPL